LAQWQTLYSCVRHLELMRTMPELAKTLSFDNLVIASRSAEQIQQHCSQGERDSVKNHIKMVKRQLPVARKAFDQHKAEQNMKRAKENERQKDV